MLERVDAPSKGFMSASEAVVAIAPARAVRASRSRAWHTSRRERTRRSELVPLSVPSRQFLRRFVRSCASRLAGTHLEQDSRRTEVDSMRRSSAEYDGRHATP